jgi:hypothetical protein
MSFSDKLKEEALIASRRTCCLCKEFAGRSTNVHHIQPEADGGPSTLGNAVVLCLRCHGEVGHYNPAHPIGNKYSPTEVASHRDRWITWCETNPHKPLPGWPIISSPDEIIFADAGAVMPGNITIYNKADFPCYDIWIRVGLSLRAIEPEDVELVDTKLDEHVLGRIGPIEIRGDAMQFLMTDHSGEPMRYLLLNLLPPRESCLFCVSLRNATADAATAGRYAKASICVKEFNPEPVGRFLQMGANKVARTIRVPEAGVLHRIVFKTGSVSAPQ